MDLISKAARFAYHAHGLIDQRRKYTNEPYIVHPRAVARLVSESEGVSEEMICAAWLHDVVEDTPYTIDEIKDEFGEEISGLVYWLTDVSKKSDGNRRERKRIDRNHIAMAPPAAKTIKLADLIDNTRTIVSRDLEFAKIYLQEKRLLLEVLADGDGGLFRMAVNQVNEFSP